MLTFRPLKSFSSRTYSHAISYFDLEKVRVMSREGCLSSRSPIKTRITRKERCTKSITSIMLKNRRCFKRTVHLFWPLFYTPQSLIGLFREKAIIRDKSQRGPVRPIPHHPVPKKKSVPRPLFPAGWKDGRYGSFLTSETSSFSTFMQFWVRYSYFGPISGPQTLALVARVQFRVVFGEVAFLTRPLRERK